MKFTNELGYHLVMLGEIVEGDSFNLKRLIPDPVNQSIFLSSNGGKIRESAKIYLHLTGGNNTITAGRQIDSAALIPFIAGSRRLCTWDTKFKFHYPTFKSNIQKGNEAQIDRFIDLVELETLLNKEDVEKFMREEVTLDAKEARECGIVHEII